MALHLKEGVGVHTVVMTFDIFKAMLQEAIFLATCLATNVARQVARKISHVTSPATATICCVASCKKSRNILNFSQRCETSCCV